MTQHPNSTARALDFIVNNAPVTRSAIATELGYSMPTVIAALSELADAGLVAQTGSRQGSHGRAAHLYGLAPRAGWVLAVDPGVTRARLEATTLDGATLFSQSVDVTPTGAHDPVLDSAALLGPIVASVIADATAWGPLRGVGVAMSHLVPNSITHETALSSSSTVDDVVRLLGLPEGVPTLLENNVNCSALAEFALRAGEHITDLAYIQVGRGIGCGLVVDRKLRRGHSGFAGEISRIPTRDSTMSTAGPAQKLEEALRADTLLTTAQARWSSEEIAAPKTLPDLFNIARFYPQAADLVNAHARKIAELVLTVAFLVDPEVIVLGGGLGENELLANLTAEHVHAVLSVASVEPPRLGPRATVAGAALIAREYVLTELIGPGHHSPVSWTLQPVVTVPARSA